MSNIDDKTPRGSTPFERFVQHIFQALTVAGLLTLGGLLWSANREMGSTTEKVATNTRAIVNLERDLREQRAARDDLSTRVTRIEEKISSQLDILQEIRDQLRREQRGRRGNSQ